MRTTGALAAILVFSMRKVLRHEDVTASLRWEYQHNWPFGFGFYLLLAPVGYLVAAISTLLVRDMNDTLRTTRRPEAQRLVPAMNGWYSCIPYHPGFKPPPHDELIEFRREGEEPWLGRWCDLHPLFNSANLWWRAIPAPADSLLRREGSNAESQSHPTAGTDHQSYDRHDQFDAKWENLPPVQIHDYRPFSYAEYCRWACFWCLV